MTRSPRAGAGVALATAAVLIGVHLTRPSGVWGDTTYLATVLAAVGAASIGALSMPPGLRRVPGLIAAGILAFTVGDALRAEHAFAGLTPGVSTPEVVAHLLGYLLLIAAILAALVGRGGGQRGGQRGGARGLDADAAIDALTIAVVSVLTFWSLVISGLDADPATDPVARTVLAGYAVADGVLLALVLRALTVRRHRRALGFSCAAGVGCWLVSDLGHLLLPASERVVPYLDAGWMLGTVLLAVATWRRPDDEEDVVPAPQLRASYDQVVLAVLPLLALPVLLVVTEMSGRHIDTVPGVVGMLVAIGVTFLRVGRLVVSEGRARTDLVLARDVALEASRAKSAFLATMSHEIRTPMNGVIGLNELLLTTTLDARQRQYAEGVRGAGHALLGVINEILDLSKIESGHLEIETVEFDLVSLVEGVGELVSESAQARGLELIASCAPEIPAKLRGDPVRIRQVLLNLAGNAVKFTSAGEVAVRATLSRAPAAPTDSSLLVHFEVADTGIGLAEEGRDRLFEPFSQADSSTTRRYGGTGLGLAICRELVEAMDGRLGVDSEVGRGSTFWFDIPLTPTPGLGRRRADRLNELAGRRALVVDDNATSRGVLRDQLRHWGMEVEVVDNGPAALVRLSAQSAAGPDVDLVLVDLVMPDMDGLELARRIALIHGMGPEPGGPAVLLMTADAAVVSEVDADEASVAAFLSKPLRVGRLRNAIRDVLRVALRPVTGPGAHAAYAVPPAAAPAAAVPSAAVPTTPVPAVATHRDTERVSRGFVLVVDDGEVNQLVAVGVLNHLGYDVEVVSDGLVAVDAVREQIFDAVLMDVQMPGMDGYRATREIRRLEDDLGRRTPVIAMTAGATDGERERCLEAGMDDYVTKPISQRLLAETLEQWIPAHRELLI